MVGNTRQHWRRPSRSATVKVCTLLTASLLATACSVTPEPLSVQERRVQVDADRAKLFTAQEPVSGPISLPEAMARAIKYNLDYRQAIMEEALQARQLDVSNLDMLPKLAANAGYTARNVPNLSRSLNTRTGDVSDDPSLSQDSQRNTADLTLSWNILDFGVSYYQAHQQANRVLIAQERRRRIINSIVQQVRATYWMAATGERLTADIEPALAEARRALQDSRSVEEERLRPPLESLRYQKALIEIIRMLETMQQDVAIAKAQLAALMNVPLGSKFTLSLPDGFERSLPEVTIPIETMETAALLNRPEMQEEHYQRRINASEVRKAMVRMLPGLTFSTSGNYDSNSYLVHNTWADAGLRVTFNLMNVLSGPAAIRAAEAQEVAGDYRRLALSMATLTQVHVAYQQFRRSRTNYDQANLLESIERRINENVQQAANAEAEAPLERIRSKASAINAQLTRDRAYAELQNSVSSLYVSLGLDPVPQTVHSHDLKGLTEGLAKVAAAWQAGHIDLGPLGDEAPAQPSEAPAQPAEAPPPASPPVAEQPVPVVDASRRAAAVAGQRS